MLPREIDVFYMLFCYVVVCNLGGRGANSQIITVEISKSCCIYFV